MLFRKDVLEGIGDGRVTLAFRRWRRPTVRAGGTLRTPVGLLAITDVSVLAPEAISEAEARRAGHGDRQALLATLGGEGDLYRIAFQRAGADPRATLHDEAPGPEVVGQLTQRLERFDRASPWTRDTLLLIARKPGVRAAALAAELGRETAPFKRDVLKLKELGLTESLEVGYRLSVRGRAYVERVMGIEA
ncbi:hypothetical protein ABLE91_12045 [Aquabacter sp. CN5-332]|uniref:hypothetical protein n=1 Tax=Aquabacter sp. CN5-332 TaxID=3156608 RepID=UPI0032B3B04A